MKQQENRGAKRAEWWTGEEGKATELRRPHPSLDFLRRFTGLFLLAPLLPPPPATSEPGLPGYYKICMRHKLNFITTLFLGDGNKYQVTMTSQ